MATIKVTDQDFDEKVAKSDKPVLVDFWAEWCGPCRLSGPVLEELSEEHAEKVTIAKIDVDSNPQMTQKYGVMSIPTVVLIKNGTEVDRQIGYAGKLGYEKLIEKA